MSLENEVDTIIEETPEVSENAVSESLKEEQEREQKFRQYTDRQGMPFDPEIHSMNADGEPILTPTGKLKRKPGRKGGSQVGAPGKSRSAVYHAPDYKTSAKHTVEALLTVSIMLGGEEWKPIYNKERGIDEQGNLEHSFERYFEAKGIADIPPGVALSIALLGYAAPRFYQPKTKSKFQRAWNWIKSKYPSKKEPVKEEVENAT